MNPIPVQSGFLTDRWNPVLFGVAAVLLLVFVFIVFSFLMIYIRALLSGSKVKVKAWMSWKQRRRQLVPDQRELERLDRIRHPWKYLGK